MDWLVDTNILIDHLRGVAKQRPSCDKLAALGRYGFR
jgi:predicted nucleic acid-binding protein